MTVWRRKPGVLLNQAGVLWFMRANARQADKSRWACSHLLTVAEQKWTLSVRARHCSKHLYILVNLTSTTLRYKFSFYPLMRELRHMFAQDCNKGQGKHSAQEACLQSVLWDPILCSFGKMETKAREGKNVSAYVKESPSLSSGATEVESLRYKPFKFKPGHSYTTEFFPW